jgi:hypothetical protein
VRSISKIISQNLWSFMPGIEAPHHGASHSGEHPGRRTRRCCVTVDCQWRPIVHDIENPESVPDLLHSNEAACYSFKSSERPVIHEPFGRAACSHLCDVRTSYNPRKMALRLMVSSTNSPGVRRDKETNISLTENFAFSELVHEAGGSVVMPRIKTRHWDGGRYYEWPK